MNWCAATWVVSLPHPSAKTKPLAVVFGCSGPELSEAERAFFRDTNPLGFILFQRNCHDPAQVKKLVADLRASVGREAAPVMIDQEGGRVARLKPPHWPEFPSAKAYADLYANNPQGGLEAARLGGRLIAFELAQLGISVDCAPVLDVPQPGADPIIGDRAFGPDAATIIRVAGAFIDGLKAGGVAAVIKHVPGHGRALVDSHKDLPRVDAPLEALQSIDFAPFKVLHMAPWAMTAHVVYEALDAGQPATTSASVIEDIIRRFIGFRGVLLSDDLSMKALCGDFAGRARACLEAGCDVALHCNGDMTEMVEVARGAFSMTRASWARYNLSELQRTSATRLEFDKNEARRRFDGLLGA
ncbi:MAG: beta-N-acetylhexosaminidase [Rhodospirillales bacterium]|nr:beta-N-acetylhexosaminidase [Rhodospirillales bacterium]